MQVTITHPTDRPNFSIVRIGDVGLAFSYETLVGIAHGEEAFRGWYVIQNYWSNTTGKHLNYLDNGDKASRLDADAFNELAAEILGRVELN